MLKKKTTTTTISFIHLLLCLFVYCYYVLKHSSIVRREEKHIVVDILFFSRFLSALESFCATQNQYCMRKSRLSKHGVHHSMARCACSISRSQRMMMMMMRDVETGTQIQTTNKVYFDTIPLYTDDI